jgi:excisionase family DNA binding protein
MLGVSESTLRQWTDEGKIRAFVTPGGHRRYSESELREFMGAQRRVHGIRDLVARIELAPQAEAELARTRFADMSWYRMLDGDSRARLACLGRRVHELVLTCVTKANRQDDTTTMAGEIGREFGQCLADIEVSLVDALEAFLVHRAPLVDAATDLIRRREAVDERAADAMQRVATITDEVLLALVDGHQERERSLAAARGERTL